jgi:hypothetical protein
MTAKNDLKALIARSLQTSEPPTYASTSHVRVTGERLHKPIYWRGSQWSVTGYGIEARDGTYAIAKDRVWEENQGYGWVDQMSEKDWVNLRDFVEALRLGRARWPRKDTGSSQSSRKGLSEDLDDIEFQP